jgi:MFS family permease
MQAWRPILLATWHGMTERRSLFILSLLLLTGLNGGLYAAVAPLLGANAAGWSTGQTSGLMAAGSLSAGLSAALLVGPLAARFGARAVASVGFAAQCALGLALVASQAHWADGAPIRAFLLLSEPLTYLLAVCLGPLAMQQCRPAVSATQFGLFMATNNLGRSLAAALLAPLESLGGFAAVLMLYAAAGAAGVAFLWVAAATRQRARA